MYPHLVSIYHGASKQLLPFCGNICYQINQIPLITAHKINYILMNGRGKKSVFNLNASNLGRWGTQGPLKPPQLIIQMRDLRAREKEMDLTKVT